MPPTRTIDWIQIHPELDRVTAHIQKVDEDGDRSASECFATPGELSTYAAFVAEVEAVCGLKVNKTIRLAVKPVAAEAVVDG